MKIYIENSNQSLIKMFVGRGWEFSTPEDADLICFSGGADVSPMLYEQRKLACTQNLLSRDEYCCNLFYTFVGKKPFVGICRGAQFLNVVSGGELFQHVDNHAIQGLHDAYDVKTNVVYKVTSTHHQMMIPNYDGAEILLTANLATQRISANDNDFLTEIPDMESVFYKDTNSLCFQPHPEYVDYNHECQELFFAYMQEYLGVE